MGFEENHVDRMVSGNLDARDIQAIISRAPAFTQGTNLQGAELSTFQHLPYSKDVFAFWGYFRNTMNRYYDSSVWVHEAFTEGESVEN